MKNELSSPKSNQESLFDAFPPVSTEAWLDKIREDLGADFEETLTWASPDDLTLRAFYRAEDVPDTSGAPLRPAGQREDNRWRLRQNVSLAAPDAPQHLREAIDGGVTDIGIDPSGAEDSTQGNFNTFLEDISLEETPLHLTGAPAEPLLALLLNTAERRGIPAETLRGSITRDPLGRWMRGEETTSPEAALDAAADAVAYATERLPRFRTLTVDARVYHEAGASTVQELVATLAAMSEYLAGLTERGLDVPAILRQMQFVIPIGTSFFVEIGKLRVLRLLFAQIADAFLSTTGQQLTTSNQQAFIQVETSLRQEDVEDPHDNLLRTTTEATAAVFGGCDVLKVRPFDAASGESSAFSRRLARNVSLLLKHEAHLDRVADPAGGSYYVEVLTHQLARHAWARFQDIEAQGGLVESLRSGWLPLPKIENPKSKIRNRSAS